MCSPRRSARGQATPPSEAALAGRPAVHWTAVQVSETQSPCPPVRAGPADMRSVCALYCQGLQRSNEPSGAQVEAGVARLAEGLGHGVAVGGRPALPRGRCLGPARFDHAPWLDRPLLIHPAYRPVRVSIRSGTREHALRAATGVVNAGSVEGGVLVAPGGGLVDAQGVRHRGAGDATTGAPIACPQTE